MGKIVKFCGSCEEGFAEKFTFCPDCGKSLEPFELNPLAQKVAVAEEASLLEVPVQDAAPSAEIESVEEPILEAAPPTTKLEPIEEPSIEAAPLADEDEWDEQVTADLSAASRASAASRSVFVQTTPIHVDRKPISFEAEHDAYVRDGQFYVTVMEEKNVKTRNRLLLGSTFFMVSLAVALTVYSLFNIPLSVYAIGDSNSLASLIDDLPMAVEEEEKQNKDKDAGGGGGGGREEEEETTQGDLADQSKNPTRPPDAKVHRSDNFELKMPAPQTEGNKTFEKKFDRWGDPNGRFASFSNGTGSGGGQGSGFGTGQGSGRGTGAGSGTGSGYGSGLGSGNGDGTGDGEIGTPPPPKAVGVSSALKVISKPRANYTEAARSQNIQGTVLLKVTFLASGQIGSVSTIRGLGGGLTESAIAAARGIKFEPAKVNGVPQTVIRSMEISFAIY
ncbi:MAG: energy transducer TonB [Pyrinomonadaceae bacterium]